jgi:hypothetical protein
MVLQEYKDIHFIVRALLKNYLSLSDFELEACAAVAKDAVAKDAVAFPSMNRS